MNPYDVVRNKQLQVAITVEELALITDGLESNIDWLEERIRQCESSEFLKHKVLPLQVQLVESQAVFERLSKLWWEESEAKEML
jgi:hypothetical protein